MVYFSAWFKIAEADCKTLFRFTLDVTKEFFRSNSYEMLIYYCPPVKIFSLYPQHKSKIWLAKTQLNKDVEADLYCNRNFIPWICKNILDITESSYDPALLFCPFATTATLPCIDGTGSVMP